MLKVFGSLMWVIGAVISYAGMQVYITWGTVLDYFQNPSASCLTWMSGFTKEWRREELP